MGAAHRGLVLLGVCAAVMAAMVANAEAASVVRLAKCADCTRKNMKAKETFKGVNGTGTHTKLAMESLVKMWSGREILALVVISLTFQLFLLLTGNLRRRRINGFVRLIVWLVYLGADAVAVYTIGLFSQYEEKYKLRSHSPGDMPGDALPFIWAPFLLGHLGGQDTITAFSLEDNNLWSRHLLVLIVKVIVVLYAFWKSIDLIKPKLIAIAVLILVAGIIKYVERIWVLYQGSRDSLANPSNEGQSNPSNEGQITEHIMASYALHTVLHGKALFAGRTMLELEDVINIALVAGFEQFQQREWKLKVIEMELGMMYDLLYTKAIVLQSWTGVIFRFVAQLSIMSALAVFRTSEKRAHNRGNVAITYTLFAGAIFTEVCSVCMVIASPWTLAHFKEGNILGFLSCSWACFPFKAMQWRRQRAGCSMGQYNLAESAYSTQQSIFLKLVSKVARSIGLEKRWINFWHIKHIEYEGIIYYIDSMFATLSSDPLVIGPRLKYVLRLPFEHAIFRLHIFTDLYISTHHHETTDHQTERECKMLSNYMMYLMAMHPSMLPVSTAAQDIEPLFAKWVSQNFGSLTIPEILPLYAYEKLISERFSDSPFENDPLPSLEKIKMVWVRLLMYAAGRCSGEEHGRQLANGGEALTTVWAIMMHHDVGDVGFSKFNLLTFDENHAHQPGSWVSMADSNWTQLPQGPRYAFLFSENHVYVEDQNSPLSALLIFLGLLQSTSEQTAVTNAHSVAAQGISETDGAPATTRNQAEDA